MDEDFSSDSEDDSLNQNTSVKIQQLRKAVFSFLLFALFPISFVSQLENNSFSYDAHLALVQALRKAGQLSHLRQAREQMHSRFPLPEGQFGVSQI